jgi:hypothetical protein
VNGSRNEEFSHHTDTWKIKHGTSMDGIATGTSLGIGIVVGSLLGTSNPIGSSLGAILVAVEVFASAGKGVDLEE